MTKQRKVAEQATGPGHIKMADGKRTEVVYNLMVFRLLDAEAETKGLTPKFEVRGTIALSQDEGVVDLTGQSFTLKTHDGRCLEAVAKRRTLSGQQWDIISSGPKGLERC